MSRNLAEEMDAESGGYLEGLFQAEGMRYSKALWGELLACLWNSKGHPCPAPHSGNAEGDKVKEGEKSLPEELWQRL